MKKTDKRFHLHKTHKFKLICSDRSVAASDWEMETREWQEGGIKTGKRELIR